MPACGMGDLHVFVTTSVTPYKTTRRLAKARDANLEMWKNQWKVMKPRRVRRASLMVAFKVILIAALRSKSWGYLHRTAYKRCICRLSNKQERQDKLPVPFLDAYLPSL